MIIFIDCQLLVAISKLARSNLQEIIRKLEEVLLLNWLEYGVLRCTDGRVGAS